MLEKVWGEEGGCGEVCWGVRVGKGRCWEKCGPEIWGKCIERCGEVH